MYFSNIPNIYYTFDVNGVQQLKILKDITINVRFLSENLQNLTVYDEYDIVDGETIEMIADKVYGNPLYHWVIMLANGKIDYREDFPVTYDVLLKNVASIYGESNVYGVHHHENSTAFNTDGHTYIVDSSFPSASEITNFQYEERLNESKRRIKLISKSVLESVVKQYSQMFI